MQLDFKKILIGLFCFLKVITAYADLDTLPTNCSHKHKQQELIVTEISLAGKYTEIPRGIECKEVCDSLDNKNYKPCDKIGVYEEFAHGQHSAPSSEETYLAEEKEYARVHPLSSEEIKKIEKEAGLEGLSDRIEAIKKGQPVPALKIGDVVLPAVSQDEIKKGYASTHPLPLVSTVSPDFSVVQRNDNDTVLSSENESSGESLINPPAKSYIFNERESKILEILLKIDAMPLSVGGKSVLGDDLIVGSALQVATEYENNEVAADQKLYKKKILLTGTINSINSGDNQPYILLYTFNEFHSPQLRFRKGLIDRIASLQKNQRLSVVCEGDGAAIGVPMFKDCQFADDYASQRIVEIQKNANSFLQDQKPTDYISAVMSIMAIGIAKNLPNSSTCLTGTVGCVKQISYLLNKSDFTEKYLLPTVVELGINLPKEHKSML